MLFNSFVYLFLFLPITLCFFVFLNNIHSIRLSKGFLFCSSLIFYSYGSDTNLSLLLFSIFFNYYFSIAISNYNFYKKRKAMAFLAVSCSLLILVFYKYINISTDTINSLFLTNFDILHVTFPLAISFFTIQQIAFLIDCYKRETSTYNILDYGIFVAFFPQLIAGPIVLHHEIMPQLFEKKLLNYKNIALGFYIFTVGLFKKVIFADTFAVWADSGFKTPIDLSFFEAWATSLSYTFQIYFDFSGYTDMAIGSALLFNISLPMNFNSPYKSKNIQEFWRKWHITLSRFLKNYIYIPLGGSRNGNFRTYINFMITFIIAGLWHGAGWTFLLWGVLHGIALIIHRCWIIIGFKLWNWLSWLITFSFINITWVFFRANSLDDALTILTTMFSLKNIVVYQFLQNRLSFLSKY